MAKRIILRPDHKIIMLLLKKMFKADFEAAKCCASDSIQWNRGSKQQNELFRTWLIREGYTLETESVNPHFKDIQKVKIFKED